MPDDIIPNQPDSGQSDPDSGPSIPLLSDPNQLATPGTNLELSIALLRGVEAISHLLNGSPALASFSIPDLIGAYHTLWEWHIRTSQGSSQNKPKRRKK